MRIIGVYTEDEHLFRKIELELSGKFELRRVQSVKDARECETVLFDGERAAAEEFGTAAVILSYGEGADVRLPLPIGALEKHLGEPKRRSLIFHEGSRTVTVFGNTVRLTEIEHALLSLLHSFGGEFVDREMISRTVWDGRADSRLINLYVHYLREKLETGGEKIILSSRKCGSAIDKKFLGGSTDADVD